MLQLLLVEHSLSGLGALREDRPLENQYAERSYITIDSEGCEQHTVYMSVDDCELI